jgi:tripartite-type tricarboxylate transporter receptor subunit TctC
VPGFGFDNWYAVFVPGGTSRDIIVKLQEAIARSLNEPDTRKLLLSQGLDAVGSTPDELAKMYAAEIAKMAKVVKQVGMQPN